MTHRQRRRSPRPSVVISPRDFGRLEGKVDAIVKALTVLEKFDERIRTLEANREHNAGRQSVISAGVAVIVAGFTAWLTKHFA